MAVVSSSAPDPDPLAPAVASLRVGLLLDSLTQPLWVSRMLAEVQALPFVEVALVVVNEAVAAPAGQPARRGPSVRGVLANRKHLLFALYSKLDTRLYTPAADPFAPTDLTAQLGDVPVLRVQPRMTKFCDYFEPDDFERVRAHDLDVAIRLGFRILKGDALRIARHGVWSYHHGDNFLYRGGPAGFWEVMEGQTWTGSILQVLTEELDDGRVLARRYGRTDRMSVASNRARCYWHSVPMVARKLRELHELGPDQLVRDGDAAPLRPYSRRLYTKPANREMLGPAARMIGRRLKSYARVVASRDQWILAYRLHGTAQRESGAPATSFYNFKPLIPPRDRFWADPFPVVRDGRLHLFIEEYPYPTQRGHISVMELGADRQWSQPRPVLELPYHLSYPFVFDWEGELFMVPETERNRSVELYRCVTFPDRWELDTVLMENVSVVDATLVEHGGRWWLFANMAHASSRDWDEELHLFHAPAPRGPWTPHRRNPVKSDVRSARPAGRLFRSGGELYRPAQDCAERYGHSITLNRVLQLDTEDYREVEVSTIRPDWLPGLVGTHTLNSAPGITVVDGLLRRPRGGRRSAQ